MTYAHIVEVAAPVEMYDAVHAEVARLSSDADGLLVHVGHPTPGGFRVLEVWESRSHFERFNDDVVLPIMVRLGAEQPGPAPEQRVEEIDVHGLVLSGGSVLV